MVHPHPPPPASKNFNSTNCFNIVFAIVHKISGVDSKYKEIDDTQLKFWTFFVHHEDNISIGWEY